MSTSSMADNRRAIVITTINPPTVAVERIASLRPDWRFIVVGDRKTAADWTYPGVDFISYDEQQALPGNYAALCPPNHYARKNIGYLRAIGAGAVVIAETDDDNIPYDSFLADVDVNVSGRVATRQGWENVYTHFTADRIWPRGFPLELVNESLSSRAGLGEATSVRCAIQQFLADGDPDVDAVYRLTNNTVTTFDKGDVILGPSTICPFNSQNTIFWPEAYPLLYLPAFVSFRMTDIWRSFVAQICLYRMGGRLAFRSATVEQVRNAHSLIRDFADEVPGYLNNGRIVELLGGLPLSDRREDVGSNLLACYQALEKADIVPDRELLLVEAWLADLEGMGAAR